MVFVKTYYKVFTANTITINHYVIWFQQDINVSCPKLLRIEVYIVPRCSYDDFGHQVTTD